MSNLMIITTMILISLVKNLNILRCVFNKIPDNPVAIAFNESNYGKVKKYLKLISPMGVVVDNSMKVEDVIDLLCKKCSEAIFYQIPPEELKKGKLSQKTKKIIHLFAVAQENAFYDNKRLVATPILFFIGRIPFEYQENLTIIPVDLDFDADVVFLQKYQECGDVIWHMPDCLEQDESWIRYAYEFWNHPNEFFHYAYEKYQGYLNELDQQINSSIDFDDVLFVLEMALTAALVKDGLFVHCIETTFNDISNLDSAIFWRGSSLYIRESLFKELFGKVYGNEEINSIKRQLYDIGVLVGKKGDYTSKMNIITQEGLKRFGMLKFDLDYLPAIKHIISDQEVY